MVFHLMREIPTTWGKHVGKALYIDRRGYNSGFKFQEGVLTIIVC